LTTVTLRASTNHQFLHEKLVPIRQILWFLRSEFIQNSDRIPSAVWCQTRVGWENSLFSIFRISVKFVNISKTVRRRLLLITNRKSHMSFRLTPWHMVVGLFLSRLRHRLPGTAYATNCVNRC